MTESTAKKRISTPIQSPAREALSRFLRNKMAVVGFFVILIFVICALFPGLIAPYGIDDQNLSQTFLSPSSEHLFGTDDKGRDIFSRVVYGCRTSLTIALGAVALGAFFGIIFGLIAGYFGKGTDNLIMRAMDIVMAIPNTLLALSIMAVLGVGIQNLILAIGISTIPQYTRLVRSSVLSVKGREFVVASVANGAGTFWILRKHILPNCLVPIIVQITGNMAAAILTAAGLSFIGLGVVPPTPEWGGMLSASRDYFRDHWFTMVYPGLAIVLSVFAINLFGDGLRDALDPKQK